MASYLVKWKVTEVANGTGDEYVHGREYHVAEGTVTKEAASPGAIREELTKVLEDAFPLHVMAGTYELDRVYDIEITEATDG